ncbi:MAG: iron ABC transporter permease [Planctomycetes bacterium]|nr:iron ABC transporter permease [Planctomycetota bacterium]MCC7171908.1 iron ABC transporter permease [Planctomycetota bacterium]
MLASLRRGIPIALALIVLCGYVAWPQIAVLLESFRHDGTVSLAGWRALFDLERPQDLRALWNSVWVALVSVLLSAIVGVPLAIVSRRFAFPLRAWLAPALLLPLLLPPIVGVLAFKQFLFGEYGIVPHALRTAFGVDVFLDGYTGVLALHAYSFFPFFVLFVNAALERLDAAQEEAARSLGASRSVAWLRVTLPALVPALLGAGALTLLNSMGSFSAPLFFAPDADLLTLRIYNLREDDPERVAVLSTILALSALALLWPILRQRSDALGSGTKGTPASARVVRSGLARLLAGIAVASTCVVLVLPHLAILVLSFGADTGAAGSVLPTAFTLDHYVRVFGEDAFRRPLSNSLWMSGLATVVDVLIGLWIAALLWRGRSVARRWIEVLALLPLALPATVIAFNLLETFARSSALAGGQVLAGTVWLLPLCYAIRNLPLTVRATQAAFAQLDPQLVEAACGLGAGRFAATRRIVLPLLLPGLAAGALLALLSALSEFTASILLYVPANLPIGVEIFNRRYNRALGEPAALSCLLLVAQALVVVVGNRLVRLGRGT